MNLVAATILSPQWGFDNFCMATQRLRAGLLTFAPLGLLNALE